MSGFGKRDGWNTAAPLGPESLTWKHFGDIRSMLILGRAGTLQNMHPVLDQALREHSNFFTDPMDRFDRSIKPIHAMIYQPRASENAATVRDFHKPIKGADERGGRYHALDPDVFWWTHVTFYESIIATQEFFGTPLSAAEQEQLIAEGLTWWRLYGMSERPAFGDAENYRRYWEFMWREVLERNATTKFAAGIHLAKVPAPKGIPHAIWRVMRLPVMGIGVWISNATMPPEARKILGWKWSRLDQAAFEVFRRTVRIGWELAPERLRYLPDSWAGMRRYRTDPAAYLADSAHTEDRAVGAEG
ncbi:oxygenase MpaB family protein [Nocardia inohanensis]|uniref:oxygenase MpaB family protein n=1 Tax=Nocardia inohanensis TaxID=209246 RepID=UPI000832B6F3|nr:oxygenase MpaB family protein [Nocardia inohanensis]